MAKKPKPEMYLYALCLDGAVTAICALKTDALERNVERTIRDAFFETWRFGGGDLKQLVDRTIQARPATPEEGEEWLAYVAVFGKPFLIIGAGGEPKGVA